ncbi:MAG: hypothetical protein JXR68_06205 [Bacteroidales bacterium]|nr:hypothetical protein [Bacteroidales bacterium]
MKSLFTLVLMLLSVSVFSQKIDAALYFNSDYAYFFKDNIAVKYQLNIEKSTMDMFLIFFCCHD